MTDVLLGQSYFLRFDDKLWEAQQPYPPLGTMYAASHLRRLGYDVALFDAMLASSEYEWQQKLESERPRFAVLFEDNFNYLSKMCLLRMREAALTMVSMAKRQGCTVIAAGADATDHSSLYLDAGADYVILGEGEATLAELLEQISGKREKAVERIAGLVYRDGEIVNTGRRPDMKALDELAFPAWDLIDVERYRSIWLERHGYFSMNIASTRGCPYHCNWCAKPIWGQRYNVRSAENVVAEIQQLVEKYRPDHLWFVDDIFGLKPGWLRAFADLVKEKGLHIRFKSLSRADLLLRPGEAEALRDAGCDIVWIGAESGSQRILDAMDKGTKVFQIEDAAARLKEVGVKVGFFLQFGYPGETLEDIEKTFAMVRRCAPDDIGMSVSYPLPGTKFFKSVESQLGQTRNWQDSADFAMLYQGPYSTRFYRQLHPVLHKEFRSKKLRTELGGLVKSPGGLRTLHLRKAASLLYYSLSLPLDRWKLSRIAGEPHQGAGPLPPSLSPELASLPSAQAE